MLQKSVFLGSETEFGKLEKSPRLETVGLGRTTSKRLHIRDRDSGLVFLIDTSSDLSFLPVDKRIKKRPSEGILIAANDTHISTYGEKRISPNIGLRRDFPWHFCVADVPNPIIGADFLAHYRLFPFLHDSRIVDTTTALSTAGFLKNASIFGVSALDRSQPYAKILAEFPETTRVSQTPGTVARDIEHHFHTTGPTIAERARRLPPEKLAIAKKKFAQMVNDGIFRPSSSPSA
ncbi:uncharacterized protein LOC117181277 [Belonocnema kinseyi]|uniref:uncharacterized protein LOC117181277 n=1 Tax=Belonocnema kinseyi TaxID=2817044 RepID=UPI00143E0161|nr:uncharacterized protein LOC117181277 [Belonocnema kinseyi]